VKGGGGPRPARSLGGVVVLTDRAAAARAGRSVVETVTAALDGGADAVVLREKDLGWAERNELAATLRDVTAAAGASLVVASDVALALDCGADGVHLAAADPWPGEGSAARLGVGRSCHVRDELVAAKRWGAVWATYSPVFESASKPGYTSVVGLDGLAAGCRAEPSLPVLALGGVDVANAASCVVAGAAGVAVMGAVMGADDPADVVRRLVAAVARGSEPRHGAAR
jgi:thiamine-phosphate pyrophosphorylase